FFLLAFAMLFATSGARRAANPQPLPRPPLTGPLLAFYGILGFSLLIGLATGSNDPVADITTYKTVVSYSMLYFLAYYGIEDRRTIHVLICVLVFVFAVAALEAIREGMAYG